MATPRNHPLLDPLALALLLVVGLIVFASLHPFKSAGSLHTAWSNMSFDLSIGLGADTLRSFLQRLVLFFPLGLLLHRYLVRRQSGYASLWSWSAVITLGLGIELLQPLVSTRHARFGDFLVATLIAGLGIVASSWVRFGWKFASGLLLLSQACVAATLLFAHQGAGIANWDCEYPLLIGNENAPRRGWSGRISGVVLYDRLVDPATVARLAGTAMDDTGVALRLREGANIIYLASALSRDRAMLTPYDNRGPILIADDKTRAPKLADGFLTLDGDTMLRTESAPKAFCEQVTATGSISIETVVQSNDVTQHGPTRIVSNSLDTYMRNFTLGEENGRIIWRVRTPTLGENGTAIPIATPVLALDARPRHVLATFSGGVARIFVDGAEARMPRYFQSIIPIHWQLWLRLDWLMLLCGLALGALARLALAPTEGRLRQVYMLSAALAPPLVFDFTVSHWQQHHPDPGVYVALTTGVVLGLAAAWTVADAEKAGHSTEHQAV